MKKMIIYILITVFVLGLVLSIALYFLNKKYNAPTRVVGSASATIHIGEDEIQFDYPKFENWRPTVNSDSTEQLVYMSNIPNSFLGFKVAPPSSVFFRKFSVSWTTVLFEVTPIWEQKNKHNIGYRINGTSVDFDDGSGGAYRASIDLNSHSTFPSPKIIIDTIANSFVVSKNKRTGIPISAQQKYGEKVEYEIGKQLQFPDFVVTHTGITKRKLLSINPNLTFTYHNFDIKTPDGKIGKISWSSGTGEISPAVFTDGKRVYWLERIQTMSPNPRLNLTENELVVSVNTESSVKKELLDYVEYSLGLYLSKNLSEVSVQNLQEALGFEISEQKNPSGDISPNTLVYTSKGFGMISGAEFRINKKYSTNALLRLDINPIVKISKEEILKEYPKFQQLIVNTPNNPTHTTLRVVDEKKTINFGFNDSDILTRITLDYK